MPNLSFLSGEKAKFSWNKAAPRCLPKKGEVFQERKESASLEKSQDSCFCPRQLPGAPRKHHSATGSILKQPGLCWARQNSSFSRNSRIPPAPGTAPAPGPGREQPAVTLGSAPEPSQGGRSLLPDLDEGAHRQHSKGKSKTHPGRTRRPCPV